jgi:hypothetical protein
MPRSMDSLSPLPLVALAMVNESDEPVKFRRVVTDELSMSLGISGDLKGSREVNEAAITKRERPDWVHASLRRHRNSGDAADLYTRPPSKISNNPFETKRAGYRSNPNIFVHKVVSGNTAEQKTAGTHTIRPSLLSGGLSRIDPAYSCLP